MSIENGKGEEHEHDVLKNVKVSINLSSFLDELYSKNKKMKYFTVKFHWQFQVELKEGEETLDSNRDSEDKQSDEREEGEVRSGAKTPPNPGPPQPSKKEFDLDAYLHNKCQFCGFIAK